MTINKIDGKKIEAVCKIIDEVSFAGTDSVVPDTIEGRSEEHTSELQSRIRISYAVFCLKLRRISIYNRTVREKSSFVVMELSLIHI